MPTPEIEVLERAARVVRARAENATHGGNPTWTTSRTLGSNTPVVVDDPTTPAILIETCAPHYERVNDHIILWCPTTAHLVAEVLERWAWTGRNFPDQLHRRDAEPVLALARAIDTRTTGKDPR